MLEDIDPDKFEDPRTLRYGSFSYTIPSLTPSASYTVRLHFAEVVYVSAGQRVFDVAINGTNVLTGFDIVATAGSANQALVEQFTATADGSGNISITVTAITDNPQLNGIEVLGSGTTIQINCGGAASSPFIADTDFSGGNLASVYYAMSLTGVTDPAPADVYKTLRYGSFSYTIPGLTPSANYTVRLHFAEIVYTSAGQRVFDVAINGTNVLTNFDIVATAGSNAQALVEEFTATADGSGNIAITFTAITDNPQINGIGVLGGGTSQAVTTNTYDPNGNLHTTTDWTGVTTYTWDSENRLLSVANSLNGSETYTYAADGMRRQKVTSAQTNNFIWDGQNVLQERNVSNVRLAQYTDYPGMWGGLASGRQVNASSFYGFDSQASTRILVSIGGIITDNYSYKTFGLELAQDTAPLAEYTVNPYHYVGQYGYYRDAISRLYVRARYFCAISGHWVSRDPLWPKESSYGYVYNRPLVLFDPTGLSPIDKACASTQPCAYINSHPGDFGELGNEAGFVICCGKKPPVVCLKNPKPGTPQANPCVQTCLTAHENQHINDYPCPGNRSCLLGDEIYDQILKRDALECNAFNAELDCLSFQYANCCMKKYIGAQAQKCWDEVVQRICVACNVGWSTCGNGEAIAGKPVGKSFRHAGFCNRYCTKINGGYGPPILKGGQPPWPPS